MCRVLILKESDDMSKYFVEDHEGNFYDSESEMCKAYGITSQLLYYRRKSGLTLKQALTLPVAKYRLSNDKGYGCARHEEKVS